MEQTRGERVRELRKSMGMTLEQFGARLGKTKAAISKIERSRDGLTKSTALLICRTYQVNMAWLLDGEGSMMIPDEEGNGMRDACERIIRKIMIECDVDQGKAESLFIIAISNRRVADRIVEWAEFLQDLKV